MAGWAVPGAIRSSYHIPVDHLLVAGVTKRTNVRSSDAPDTLWKVMPAGGATVVTVFPVYVSPISTPLAEVGHSPSGSISAK